MGRARAPSVVRALARLVMAGCTHCEQPLSLFDESHAMWDDMKGELEDGWDCDGPGPAGAFRRL